jgi:hypothetical protein
MLRALLLMLLLPVMSMAQTVSLQWDANTETDLAGYKVYQGTASRNYGTPTVLGLVTTYAIPTLQPGTYYFAVTAYNTSQLESGYSNEVSVTIPIAPTAPMKLRVGPLALLIAPVGEPEMTKDGL